MELTVNGWLVTIGIATYYFNDTHTHIHIRRHTHTRTYDTINNMEMRMTNAQRKNVTFFFLFLFHSFIFFVFSFFFFNNSFRYYFVMHESIGVRLEWQGKGLLSLEASIQWQTLRFDVNVVCECNMEFRFVCHRLWLIRIECVFPFELELLQRKGSTWMSIRGWSIPVGSRFGAPVINQHQSHPSQCVAPKWLTDAPLPPSMAPHLRNLLDETRSESAPAQCRNDRRL